MKSLGIFLDDLHLSQLNFYMISHVNNLIRTTDYDPIIFFKNIGVPAIRPFCACMNASEIWTFNGTLISTNLDSALTCIKATNNAKNILYLWDLEWMRGKNDYVHNVSILRHPLIKVITRSKDHAKVVENYANITVSKIVEDANILELIT